MVFKSLKKKELELIFVLFVSRLIKVYLIILNVINKFI